jgi:hypothetical protein
VVIGGGETASERIGRDGAIWSEAAIDEGIADNMPSEGVLYRDDEMC